VAVVSLQQFLVYVNFSQAVQHFIKSSQPSCQRKFSWPYITTTGLKIPGTDKRGGLSAFYYLCNWFDAAVTALSAYVVVM
jgi:hypothetical protein